MKYCINLSNGQLFGWTEALSKRPDFVTYAHPLKRDLEPAVHHEPPDRLDDAPVRVASTYENSAPDHLVPFTLVAERMPQFFDGRGDSIHKINKLNWLFKADALADCVFQCGNHVYLGIAETLAALDKIEAPIAEYAEHHRQALREAKAALMDAPARSIEGCEQRLARAQDKADTARAKVDSVRSQAAGMDILDPAINMRRLEAIRGDYRKAAVVLDGEIERLAVAQADLDEALEAVERKQQASDDAPAFKAPSQKAECTRLGCSERHFRDLFDKFKIDYDTGPLRWARLTRAQYDRFNQWLESQAAAA